MPDTIFSYSSPPGTWARAVVLAISSWFFSVAAIVITVAAYEAGTGRIDAGTRRKA